MSRRAVIDSSLEKIPKESQSPHDWKTRSSKSVQSWSEGVDSYFGGIENNRKENPRLKKKKKWGKLFDLIEPVFFCYMNYYGVSIIIDKVDNKRNITQHLKLERYLVEFC